MRAYFATAYTIHFDDTMAYGSHHFLTSFKFQCAAREAFLFGERVFDVAGVRESLDRIHLITSDAYARNLNPARLGDRLAILLTLEEWGRASARFCYRVIDERGRAISAGFQTLICADSKSGQPVPLPTPLRDAMEQLREIEEPAAERSFRDRVLAGGSQVESLFDGLERATAAKYLAQRHPSPQVLPAVVSASVKPGLPEPEMPEPEMPEPGMPEPEPIEVWMFSGQGTFHPALLAERLVAFCQLRPSAREELLQAAAIAQELIGGNASLLVGGCADQAAEAVRDRPELSQVAIHLQNVLAGYLRQARGLRAGVLMGQSLGEIAALGVAGCFDLPTGVRIVCERVRAVASYAPADGCLLAVATARQVVETEAAWLGLDQVVVAGRNHDRQTIVSGPHDQLDPLRKNLEQLGIRAVPISSPTSFHHPGLRSAAMAWLKQLRMMPLRGPSVAVYSSIGRRFLSANDDVAAILASHLVRPFDLQGGILDVLSSGATRFIDCGSTGALARIMSQAGPEDLDVRTESRQATKPATPSDTHADAHGRIPAPPARRTAPRRAPNQRRSASEKPLQAKPDVVAPRVAIVGQGCILPGGANSPKQLYRAITEQRMGIVDQRDFDANWEEDFYSEKLVADRSTSPLMGRVDEDDIVVPRGVSPELFADFTRAQRLLCIALAPCVASLRDAERIVCLIGSTADGFENQDVVSSLRLAGIDACDLDVDRRLNSARSATEQPYDAVQEVFDKMVRPGLDVTLIDAACASSLYAVALGMQVLESNQADAVLAGGIFCPGPGNSSLFSQFRGTTSTGCRPFDAEADGVVFSEGAALVTLRRAADAERLGLPLAAIARGAGLSSDGRSSSANVPQSRGQVLSLNRCYANYAIDPGSIQAVEAHGTSTPVGDATELETLRSFYTGRAATPLPVHSLKGLLGHAGWAAGTASLIAACQYISHRQFPAQAGHRQPSEALLQAEGTLNVPTRPVPLPDGSKRIAVDGFGFGGANAHIVLESHEATEQHGTPVGRRLAGQADHSLVVVAYHELEPALSSPGGRQFDRSTTALPAGHVVLPDLADDMDITQTLTISLVDAVLSKIPGFCDSWRQVTGVVVAQRGNTERAVEATLRVHAGRLRRNLAGLDAAVAALDAAVQRARPSGPYTLQCMMPNVSAGRAALQLDLNGPNFVVDAGHRSLEAALRSASWLLQSGDAGGSKLVVVAAVEARSLRAFPQETSSAEPECAAAFAVTTAHFAKEQGLQILSALDDPLPSAYLTRRPKSTMQEQVRLLIEHMNGGKPESGKLGTGEQSSNDQESDERADNAPAVPTSNLSTGEASVAFEESRFKLHAPVWVEAALPNADEPVGQAIPGRSHLGTILAIAPADEDQVAELLAILPGYGSEFKIAVAGVGSEQVVARIANANVFRLDVESDEAGRSSLAAIDELEPETIVAVRSVASWEANEVLRDVAADNGQCEALFLAIQSNLERIRQGRVQLWGLFPGAWDGERVHPCSGPVAGMLKAVAREIAAARAGVVCTRGILLDGGFERLLAESKATGGEAEIVYDDCRRLVRRLRPIHEDPKAARLVELDTDSVVVATGGARGVTAVLLEALLRDYGCTVVAIGRSPLEAGPSGRSDAELEREFFDRFVREHPGTPPMVMKTQFERTRAGWEAEETIERLSSLGGRVEYIVGDVTDSDQMEAVVQQIAARFGRVDLLIHGAGVQKSKRLEDRTLADFRNTYSVKVVGLHNLVHLCRRQFGKSVCAHVLTSAYSVFGNDGQHDYGAANETLDRLCELHERPEDGCWSSIAWLAWDGIGMTRGSEYRLLAKSRGLSGLTPADGQRMFREVLSGRTRSAIHVPLTVSEHVKYGVRTLPPARPDSSRRSLNAASSTERRERNGTPCSSRILEVAIELSQIACLEFHTVRQTPTLPGAWILDCMVHAAAELAGEVRSGATVDIRNVSFQRFVRCSSDSDPNIRVVAERTPCGISVWMVGDVNHPSGIPLSKDRVLAEATICFDDPAIRTGASVGIARSTRSQFEKVYDPYCAGGHDEIRLSGPFDCLRDIELGPSGRRATFMPDGGCSWTGSIPALLLDAAWRVGAMYAESPREELYVPVRIGRVRIAYQPNVRFSSAFGSEIRTTAPRVEENEVHWERTLVLDASGESTLVVEDVSATRLR